MNEHDDIQIDPNLSKDLDSAPVAQCSECGRETWLPDMVDMTCYAPLSSGDRCSGRFERIDD